MALNKQRKSIPFITGIDSKTDSKQLQIGSFTALENVNVTKPGKLLKRNGYENITLNTIDGEVISNIQKISTYKKELNIYSNENLYSKVPSLNKWVNKGVINTVQSSSKQIVRTSVEQSKLKAAHVEGLNAFVWEDENGVSISLIDNESNNFLIDNTVLSASGTNPKIVNRENVIYVFYKDSTTIKYRKFNIFDFANIDAEVTIVTSMYDSSIYDVKTIGDNIYIAFPSSTNKYLSIKYLSEDDLEGSTTIISGEVLDSAVDISTDSSHRVIVTYSNPTDVKVAMFNFILTAQILAPTSIATTTDITNLTTVENDGNYYTVYEKYSTKTYDHYLNKIKFNVSGTVESDTTIIRSVGLASKAFLYDDTVYVTVVHDNTLQSTYFLASLDGSIVSKISQNIGGDVIAEGGLTEIPSISSSKFLLTSQVKGMLTEENGTFFSILGVNSSVLDFNSESKFKNVTLADNLHIAGGILKMYDGKSVVEHGFHVYPEGLEKNGDSPSDGVLEIGLYNYKSLYSWTDAQGNVHRSAPSIGLEVDLNSVLYPTGTTNGLTKEITYTSATAGSIRNLDTITLKILAAAANPTDTVLAVINGTIDAVDILITPNDGTNNGAIPVNITTTQLAELVSTDTILGKNVTLTDSSSLLTDLSATGGDNTIVVNLGEGDEVVATLTGGETGGLPSVGTTTELVSQITYQSTERDSSRNGSVVTTQILPNAANPGNYVLANVTGNLSNTIITIVPNDGTNSGTLPSATTTNTTYFPTPLTLKSLDTYLPNGVDIQLVSGGASANPYIEVSLLFIHPSMVITVVADNVSGTLTTEELVEAINTGAVVGKTVVINDPGVTKIIGKLLASGGDNTILPLATILETIVLAGGVYYFIPFTTADISSFLSTGNTTSNLEMFISDSSGLLDFLEATGGDDTTVVSGGEADGISVTLEGGDDAGTSQQQTLAIPTLRLTDKENATIELYRTEKAGTIFYKVNTSPSIIPNDKTVDTVNITDDSTTDEDLISNEVLYTTGDVLENLPVQSGDIIENFKSRIFTTTPESRKWNYSKIQYEGFPVEFNDTLEISLPEIGGDNVAGKSMDDKLIFFRESAIYFISGDGPNNLGEQNTFVEPQLISSEIGCSESESIVLLPDGIMFKSPRGIYLLSRGLQLAYIGAPVEAFNDLEITSAITVPNKNIVRFTTNDGDCLVYNYVQKKWITYTNHKAKSATRLGSDYFYVRNDDLLYKENSEFSDNGTPIKTKVETGWISFSNIQGFQRVYRMLILGEFKSDHKLRVKVAYDFKEAYTQEKVVEVSDFTSDTAYGESSPYGTEATYGSANLYQMRLDFENQKCQSIKICIEDIQDEIGEGMELSNIMFVYGVKTGDYKPGSGHNSGTSS